MSVQVCGLVTYSILISLTMPRLSFGSLLKLVCVVDTRSRTTTNHDKLHLLYGYNY